MNKKKKVYLTGIFLLIVAGLLYVKFKPKVQEEGPVKEASPFTGSIHTVISTTGTVLPKNRLEIKPPVNGRVESILVKEGEKVKTGQTLAIMSSTERAALLDAAQNQGPEKLKYWQEVYKPIILLAPINGEVIVATIQPGQTVTTVDAIIVLSDELIVRAQVDETDIGKISVGQKAFVNLDAYPDSKINALVEHIYYESETVNNVTIYKVDLIPETVPVFFRSGMNAAIDFIDKSKDNTLLVPVEAVYKDKQEFFVLLKQDNGKEPLVRPVETGISDDKNIEILSGVSAGDTLIIKNKKYALPKNNHTATNPLTPFGQRRPGGTR